MEVAALTYSLAVIDEAINHNEGEPPCFAG
jgi:hypothetical protein